MAEQPALPEGRGMSPAPPVRKAVPEESTTMADALSAAFDADPVMQWWIADDTARRHVVPRFFRFALDHLYLRHGETFVAEDVAGVAAWCPPGTWRSDEEELAELAPGYLGAIGEEHFQRGAILVAIVEEVHPEEPHWYLPFIGVRPASQGRGLGSALLAAMTSRLDAGGAPAYLEASTERNRALYLRHGFAVTGEIVLPDGPTMWQMWREPSRSRGPLADDARPSDSGASYPPEPPK
jgi:ribosomal protein S18 acetylase RimI-like enzyme